MICSCSYVYVASSALYNSQSLLSDKNLSSLFTSLNARLTILSVTSTSLSQPDIHLIAITIF